MGRPLIIVAALLALPACDKHKAAPRPFAACSRAKRCPSPQICVLRAGLTAGQCVKPCDGDSTCGQGNRCTGRYRPDGSKAAQHYCQRATVPPGGDCSGLRDGCQAGTECRYGRTCVRTCAQDTDCGDEGRCVPVQDRRVFGKPQRTLYRVCVKATLKTGATCGPNRLPLCARGYRCHRQRCVKRCTQDTDCGEGSVCDGQLGAATGDDGSSPPAERYCRRTAAPGERCGRNPIRDIACTEKHTCYHGRCRRMCESNEDCAETTGRRRRCRTRRRRGAPFRICL